MIYRAVLVPRRQELTAPGRDLDLIDSINDKIATLKFVAEHCPNEVAISRRRIVELGKLLDRL